MIEPGKKGKQGRKRKGLKKRYVNVGIEEDLYISIQQKAGDSKQALKRYLNADIRQNMESDAGMKTIFPNMTVNEVQGSLVVSTAELGEVFGVIMDESNRLYCKNCKSSSCDHVLFAYTKPKEVTKIIKNKTE